MARITKWNNIEPMLRRITLPVMINTSLLAALITFERSWAGEFARNNRIVDRSIGLAPLWIFAIVSALDFFALFALAIFAIIFFIFFRFCVFENSPAVDILAGLCLGVDSICGIYTILTPTPKTVRVATLFVKLRHAFCLLAFRAGLCLNCLRHSFTSVKVMFKAVCGLRPADGLFYCTTTPICNKGFLRALWQTRRI